MASILQLLTKRILANGYVLRVSAFHSNITLQTYVDSYDTDAPVSIKNPFEKEKAVCILCDMKIVPDYKNVRLLSQFQSPYTGRIYGRHITGLCKKKQELLEKEIIKAQGCGLMPGYHKNPEFLKDPKLFDSEKPIRPHKY